MEIKNFQEFIIALCNYWVDYGCIWSQPYDANMGAGTFHPHTFLKGIGPEPWRCVFVQPCRRPVDGRYGKSPYRFQHYYQLQVLLKPAPANIVDIYLNSLQHVGIHLKENDIGLIEDDWKGPTLGAWGLGWEIRANAQEVSQFTYFQQLGGINTEVISGEITYGLERLFMYAKGYQNAMDMPFNEHFTYGDIFYQNEYEQSFFNFKEANIKDLQTQFEKCELKIDELCKKNLVLPAYDYVLQASHAFNLLDARGALSVGERQAYIGRVRECAKKCAMQYQAERKKLGFPLLNKLSTDPRLPLLPKSADLALKARHDKLHDENNYYIKEKDFLDRKDLSVTFELGVEEIPPSFQTTALQFLMEQKNELLHSTEFKNELSSASKSLEMEILVSSRRLSIQFKNLPKSAPNRSVEFWGPAERIAKGTDGTLSQAGLGFCKKNNIDLASVSFKAKDMRGGEGSFLYAVKEEKGKDYPSLLAEKFVDWCYQLAGQTPGLPVSLKMRWLPEDISKQPFIRPARWILALVEDKVIPLPQSVFGLKSGRYTCGQRILSPDFVAIPNASDYQKILEEKLFVVPSPEKRKEKILDKARSLAKEINGELYPNNSFPDSALLQKCVGLYESPAVFRGEFDKKYLKLPPQLITSVLREHMFYFSIINPAQQNLLPYYIGCANYQCKNMENMILGTQNVVTGRLDDGAFYYETDLKTPILEFKESLRNQVFQDGMGTLFDKSQRLKELVNLLNVGEKKEDTEILETAAEYCKADLKTGCVQEFPDEMQGIMGGILLEEQNLLKDQEKSKRAAAAIKEHYLPTSAQASLPITPLGVILSLADKLDSLCIMMNHGTEIKANKDPLGLRRLALGIARLLGLKNEANALSLSVREAVQKSLQVLHKNGIKLLPQSEDKICFFIFERMKPVLAEEFDLRSIDALSRRFIEDPLAKTLLFAKAIGEALKHTGKGSLLEALAPYKRARNLTKELTHSQAAQNVQADLFVTTQEKALFQKLCEVKEQVQKLLEQKQFEKLLVSLSSLAEPLAAFFESVMVNDPDKKLQQNRLCLLMKIRSLYESVADFSLLQVQ